MSLNTIKIYFDGNCGLCSKEINYYKKIDKKNIFKWVDIYTYDTVLKKYGIIKSEALMELHALDENGKMYKGVDSFILIWKNLSFFWSILGILVSFYPIYIIAKFAYRKFAIQRFNKLGYCDIKTN
ncbi:MAG: thiol-disulfide oxidoreductase DCC family protein [Paracoccaceae bacterium]